MSVISPSEVTSLLSPVNAFLHCETPQSWINEAQKEEKSLAINFRSNYESQTKMARFLILIL